MQTYDIGVTGLAVMGRDLWTRIGTYSQSCAGKVGIEWMRLIQVLKEHFDPHNIMNPGGTLGLDISEEQKNKHWGFTE